jgi:hypothetical protein
VFNAALPCDQRGQLLGHLGLELRRAPANDDREILHGERLQFVDLRPGEERGVDLEVGVFRRRSDEHEEAGLHSGEKRVLLRLVEAVDLVEKEDRPLAAGAHSLGRPSDHRPDVGDRGGDRGELLEGRAGRRGYDARQGRLPASRRAVEDR